LPEVIAVLSCTLQCRSRLPSSSSGISAACRLDRLFSFFLHRVSVDSSWVAPLSELLTQPWTWSTYSWRCSSCAMPLLHSGTPSWSFSPQGWPRRGQWWDQPWWFLAFREGSLSAYRGTSSVPVILPVFWSVPFRYSVSCG
jgi:hypothetical protein